MKLPFGRRVTAMLPYALAFFILFFLAGVLLTTAITEMGVTPIFTSMAIPLACGALAFLGALGVAMAEDAKEGTAQ
ncbi:MAG: hypothetical protein AOA65_1105 [Candidatus Bathyarchaeota archaeon BA1]|nr:MAG: hypothetical protein AOA65_1105 [Candidatus Bathyarchaeota archaeon BA1]